MKIEEAIAYAKEQTEIFAGKHRVFLYLAIEALERQFPVKIKCRHKNVFIRCPECNKPMADNSDIKFCSYCGKALDWSEVRK